MHRLELYTNDILSSFNETINKYIKEKGNPKSIGIYSSSSSGWISFCFNILKELIDTGNNCPDFDDVEYGLFQFDGWNEEYYSDEGLNIIYNNNVVGLAEVEKLGDEALNKLVFEYLKDIFKVHIKSTYENRMLIQMLDSKYLVVI